MNTPQARPTAAVSTPRASTRTASRSSSNTNENVINQGLYYLDWLLDHKAEFELLSLKKLGTRADEVIDWSGPRLLCIAGDFTKYDVHAVQQINRNVELIRYRQFDRSLLLLDLVNVTSQNGDTAAPAPPVAGSVPAVVRRPPAPRRGRRSGRGGALQVSWHPRLQSFSNLSTIQAFKYRIIAGQCGIPGRIIVFNPLIFANQISNRSPIPDR